MNWPLESLLAVEWIERCALQLTRADPDIDDTAAIALANEMYSFPRTAAMAPEGAVEFVAHQLAQAVPRFDRRRSPR
jgi:hypothetical protein